MSRKLYLYVFCDALGWEVDRRRPVAGDLLPRRQPLNTIFGYSSTCDPTILTGLMPRDHGHFSCFFFSPKTTPFRPLAPLSLLPKKLTERGRVRSIISRIAKRFYGYTGYFQLYNMPFDRLPYFDYSEKKDIYKPGGILSGAPTIFAAWERAGLRHHVSNWHLPEPMRIAEAEAAIQGGEIDCAYVYLADLDATLHRVGPTGPEADAKLDQYTEILRRFHTLAKEKYDEVSMHLFSDHGMTAVDRTFDMMPLIERTGLKFGEDYAAVYDSTMARFWYLKPESRAKIEAALAKVSEGHWVSAEQLAGYGCDFKDNAYGDAFFLLDPGILLCPSFMGSSCIAGMHGFAPEHKDSVALYATNDGSGPAPHRLDDLYRVMMVPVEAKAAKELVA